MILISRKSVHRLYCDGCERRIASASSLDRLLALACENVGEGGMLSTSFPLSDIQWFAYCPACAADPEATAKRRQVRKALLEDLLWD